MSKQNRNRWWRHELARKREIKQAEATLEQQERDASLKGFKPATMGEVMTLATKLGKEATRAQR